MQTIVLKLTHQGRPIPTNPSTICHWLDLRVPPAEVQHRALDDIKERRQIKTHLRFDAIKYDPDAKYIYIGRDGRDCYMSLINHYRQGNDLWYGVINGPPAFVGDPLPVFDEAVHSESKLFDRWISEGWPSLPGETDGYPFWSLFDHVRTWWEVRHLPNILFVHYNDLLSDLAGGVREIARFLDIAIDEENFPAMIESLTFEGMKATCCIPEQTLVPMGGAIFKNGGNSFINKVLTRSVIFFCYHWRIDRFFYACSFTVFSWSMITTAGHERSLARRANSGAAGQVR
jgi:aryl sulfotransferase